MKINHQIDANAIFKYGQQKGSEAWGDLWIPTYVDTSF